jgi:hypothetical protein
MGSSFNGVRVKGYRSPKVPRFRFPKAPKIKISKLKVSSRRTFRARTGGHRVRGGRGKRMVGWIVAPLFLLYLLHFIY